MVRERSGALKIDEKVELTPGEGAKKGVLVDTALSIIFPPTLLAGSALGAVAGAITGKATDQGFVNVMLEELARDLEPGKSAIFGAIDHRLYTKMREAVDGYEKVTTRTYRADDDGIIELLSHST